MFWFKPKGENFHAYMDKIIGGLINCCNTYIKTHINNALPEVDPAGINTSDTNTLLKLILLQLAVNQTQSAVIDKSILSMLTQMVQAMTPNPEQVEMQKQFFEDFKKRRNDENEGDWWKRGGKEPV